MKRLLLTLILLTASSGALALDEINTTYFGNLAIEGYDAAAYFTEQRAIEGSSEQFTVHNGKLYLNYSKKISTR